MKPMARPASLRGVVGRVRFPAASVADNPGVMVGTARDDRRRAGTLFLDVVSGGL
jgi:hypothetical protein